MSGQRLTLVPRYTAGEAAPAFRVTLEPEYVDRRAALADLADVDAMLAAVLSGASARGRQLDRCRWARFLDDFRLEVSLEVRVWPSDINVPYSLSVPDGVSVGPKTALLVPVSRHVWIDRNRLVDLPWLLRDARVEWVPELSCYDGAGRETPRPNVWYVAQGARVAVQGEAYGLLRVSGMAQGFTHTVTIIYDKASISDAPSLRPRINTITADDIDVSCLWQDESGEERTETARLAIPACVKTLLATCADGTGRVKYKFTGADGKGVVVYYSTCDGTILAVRRDTEQTTGDRR